SKKIVTLFTTYYTRDPDAPFSSFFVGKSTLVERFEGVICAVCDYLAANPVPLQLVVKLHQCDDNMDAYQAIAAKFDIDVLFLTNIEAGPVISCSDICISPISSVIVSIALAGKPLLIVDDTVLPQDRFYQRAKFASFSFNKAELGDAVYRKLEELHSPRDISDSVREFISDAIGEQDTNSYTKLLMVINGLRQQRI
ncbi:MAG: hypothetical protein HGA87_08010, partial [Desulfobulbaceae bacterium]|nr:hypothetical protein [Desulfobulbaceae bacterium]